MLCTATENEWFGFTDLKTDQTNKEHKKVFFFYYFIYVHDFFLIVTRFLAGCHVAVALQGLY